MTNMSAEEPAQREPSSASFSNLQREQSGKTFSSNTSWKNDVPSTLTAEKVWYTLHQRKKGLKVILQDISVQIESGKVLAIMGPSGAGKTMFLNALTLQRGPGIRYGTVRLNGNVFTNSMFEATCSLVTQMDIQWTFLTCRQALMLAADLFALPGVDRADKQSLVESLCQKSGMTDCLDKRIGNAYIPGLAFGQRRRLSLMVSLLKNPLVVFLDEPTTNLDSSSAAGIMKLLKVVASELNIIIVCTIHQPDRHVFAGFDSLLLLSEGQVAYNGSAASAEQHFRSLGHVAEPGVNPADFLLDLMNRSFTDPEIVDSLLQAWTMQTQQSQFEKTYSVPRAPFKKHALVEIAVLLRRHLLLFVRDPSLYLLRVLMITLSSLFFALCYIESRTRKQEQALNRTWLFLWLIGVPGNLAVVACFALNLEFVTVKYEVLSGMYKLYSYIIAHTLVQLPVMLLNSVCAISISGYAIAGWNGEQYVPMVFAFALCYWSFECAAQACSVGKSNPLLGMMDFMNYWFCAFLFCGFLLRSTDVIWPFRALVYVLPLRHTIKACAYLEYDGTFWEGAEEDNSSLGFYCPGKPLGVGCYGRTGKQVLKSLHQNYDVVDDVVDVSSNIFYVFVICLFFKLIYVATAYVRCRSVAPPKPLPEEVRIKILEQIDVIRQEDQVTSPKSPGTRATPKRGTPKERVAVNTKESQAVFSVEKAWHVTKEKKMQKCLLEDVSFSVYSGEILAVMGPSGAGKTLLLNLASLLRNNSKGRFGTVKLNSMPFSSRAYSQYASQILQSDCHWPFLTPRESISMAVNFYSGEGAAKKTEFVDELLLKMGLERNQHTRLGNQFIPGCSGGQRRRASIALAMAKNPLVLFLDEPTAGLDAAAAYAIVTIIKEWAAIKDIVVVCTLSQPSVEIFDMIDQLVLLSEGRVAYSGSARRAIDYFESIGHSPSMADNPAEFLVGLLNRGFVSSEQVDDVLNRWPGNSQNVLRKIDPLVASLTIPPVAQGPRCLARLAYLLKRHLLLVIRDPTMYSGRIVGNALSMFFFCLMYIHSRQAVQEQVLNRIFLMMWSAGVPTNLILVAVYAHQEETTHVIYENRSGMYGCLEYILAQASLQLLLLPLCTLSVVLVAFGVGNWPWESFIECWAVYTLGYWVNEAVSQCLAVRPLHVLLNMLDYCNFWFTTFLFCGMVLPKENVVWPLRTLVYINPLSYVLRTYVYIIMKPQDYEGAVFSDTDPRGFVCDSSVSVANCFGPTGCEVLDTAHNLFDTLSCDDTRSQDVLYIIIMIVVFKLMFSLGLVGRCMGLSPLREFKGSISSSSLNGDSPQVAPPDAVETKTNGNMDTRKNGNMDGGPEGGETIDVVEI